MSGKRKASVFEEDMFNLQQNIIPSSPSLTSSPQSTTSTISYNSDTHPYLTVRIKAVPYLNSRTRKRYRDDRPNEEIIHENTLRKLYDAQRLHLDEAMPMSDVIPLGEDGVPMDEADAEMIGDVPEAEIPQTAQPNQRTIDAFFGGRGNSQSRENMADQAAPNTLTSTHSPSNRPRQHIQMSCSGYWNGLTLLSVNGSAAAR
ncbi:uncharacterized protein Z519_00620 [Cladophialophora bantiana CBS 173.52]|uniref:Uncharacterized protein n=1 Tax=Cladophialophora bantiana (strain ATCC 10958 / CBS 173.52 / CDC B-1940 / NIH 8579) TaxID=1442370 RepID=A0A0D2GKM7_CLAB1|nr:uncharacterized protein Z519_00620 [Cladophialophora bantiana CBS 173.52]KIW98957.1 hypothetical protein Z519_00620 [Cladophialophora bantiana CBS 173.52]